MIEYCIIVVADNERYDKHIAGPFPNRESAKKWIVENTDQHKGALFQIRRMLQDIETVTKET